MKSSGEEMLRRDALARSICSRVCDERRTEPELRRVDGILSAVEREPRSATLKLYIAASSAEMDRARAAINAATYSGFEVVSTWLDVVANVGDANPQTATRDERHRWASQDLGEVDSCDALWFLVPSESVATRGAWGELGFAYATGKAIVCSGTNTTQSIFTALGEEFESDLAALQYLKNVANAQAAVVATASRSRVAGDAGESAPFPSYLRARRITIPEAPPTSLRLTFDTTDEPDGGRK